MRSIPAIILAPLIAHPLWALLMIGAPMPLHTMGIDSAYSMAHNGALAVILMVAASIGAILSHLPRFHGKREGLLLVSLQQTLMLWGLWTVLVSVFSARYANGYAPPEGWRFIAADQCLFGIISVLHTRQIWLTYSHNYAPTRSRN